MPDTIQVGEAQPRYGPKVIGDHKYKVEQHEIETGGQTFGSRVTVDSPGAAVPDLTDMNVEEAEEAIAQMDNVPALERLLNAEKAHPRYEGGRKGVKDAIEERLGELQTA